MESLKVLVLPSPPFRSGRSQLRSWIKLCFEEVERVLSIFNSFGLVNCYKNYYKDLYLMWHLILGLIRRVRDCPLRLLQSKTFFAFLKYRELEASFLRDVKMEHYVLGVQLIHPEAQMPMRASNFAAGLDLFSVGDGCVMPGERILVPTGIRVLLPLGCYGRIAPRSGLAFRNGIDVGAGVIDPDYRGEVMVLMFNFGNETFFYKKGDRIAQLILEKCIFPQIVISSDLGDTTRGSGGFGSTGV